MGARPWLARTQEDYASMLLERSLPRDEERAQRLLDDAGAAYRESGMTGHVERVRGAWGVFVVTHFIFNFADGNREQAGASSTRRCG